MKASFFVRGEPRPKGSTSSFRHNKSGAIITRQKNARLLGPWQRLIGWEARAARVRLTTCAVRIRTEFIFARPRSHYVNGDGQRLRASAPMHHLQTPDADKLLRAVLDALTGVAWADDKQVVDAHPTKRWGAPGEPSGVFIEIEAIEEREVT